MAIWSTLDQVRPRRIAALVFLVSFVAGSVRAGVLVSAPITLEPGDLLVSDGPNGRIVRVDPDTGDVDLFASGLGDPGDLVQAPDGTVYVVRREGGLVLGIDPATGVPDVVEVTTGCPPTGTTPLLSLDQPWGLAVDANGALYVADRSSGTYRLAPSASFPGAFELSFLVGDGVFLGTRGLAVTSDGAGDGDQLLLVSSLGDLVLITLSDELFFSPPSIPTVPGATLYGVDVVGNCLDGSCTAFFSQSSEGANETCDTTGLYSYARIGMLSQTATLFDIFPNRCVFDLAAVNAGEVFLTTAEDLNGGVARVVRMFKPGSNPWDGIVVANLADGAKPFLPTGMTRVTVRAPEPSAALQFLAACAALVGRRIGKR